MIGRIVGWLVELMAGCSIGWLIEKSSWLIDKSNWLIDWSIDWFDRLICFIDWWVDWLLSQLVDWPVDQLIGLVNCLPHDFDVVGNRHPLAPLAIVFFYGSPGILNGIGGHFSFGSESLQCLQKSHTRKKKKKHTHVRTWWCVWLHIENSPIYALTKKTKWLLLLFCCSWCCCCP